MREKIKLEDQKLLMYKMKYLRITFFFLCFSIFGCTSLQVKKTSIVKIEDNQKVKEFVKADDGNKESLLRAVKKNYLYLNTLSKNTIFNYGKDKYSVDEVIDSFLFFEKILMDTSHDEELFISSVIENFQWFEVNADVLFTAYYEPIVEGSLYPTDKFSVPAYTKPKDLKVLNLGKFRSKLTNQTIVYKVDNNNNISPYYTRKDIMEDGILKNRGLEIVWFKNPIDLFFMQIQGSGIVRTAQKGNIRLSYGGANGRSYTSIGKILINDGSIAREKMSAQAIKKYLRTNPNRIKEILYKNESYTFFSINDTAEGPYGNIGVPLTPYRSLATDYLLFPKAALSLITTEIPICNAQGFCKNTKKIQLFTVIQDTGGAIRGYQRADLFLGRGKVAEYTAGGMQHRGKHHLIIKKK